MKSQRALNVLHGAFGNEPFSNVSTQNVRKPYLLFMLGGALSVLTMCGNLLVITSIVYFKQLHTPTNYLILSLAVTDLLVGVFILPFSSALPVRLCRYDHSLLCYIQNTFDVFLCSSSILHLCFISVDRYYVVCQPLVYKAKITVGVVLMMISFTWSTSALICVAITLRKLHLGQSTDQSLIQQNALPGTLFSFFIPALVIFAIYLKIFTVAQKHARSIQSRVKSVTAVGKMERKATKTLAIVVGVFVLTWSPFFFSLVLYQVSESNTLLLLTEHFKWVGWSNSMLNPLVYAFFYGWFRSAFKMIISVRICRQDLSNSKLS